MKKLPKAKIDELLELTRVIFDAPGSEEADRAIMRSIALSKEIDQETGSSWLALHDLMTASRCLKRDVTNEDIYKVLEVLGWQVIDDDQGDR